MNVFEGEKSIWKKCIFAAKDETRNINSLFLIALLLPHKTLLFILIKHCKTAVLEFGLTIELFDYLSTFSNSLSRLWRSNV